MGQTLAMLIVEDQECMGRTLVEFVQSAYPDITIIEAADGAGAPELCDSKRPQLLLMEVAPSHANGIEFTAQIKEMLPEEDAVIVSQHAAEAYVEPAHVAGARCYVTKDKVYRELLPTLDRLLGLAPSDHAVGNLQRMRRAYYSSVSRREARDTFLSAGSAEAFARLPQASTGLRA